MSAIGERAPETAQERAPDWSPVPERTPRSKRSRLASAALRALIGLGVAGLMWWLGHGVAAAVLVGVLLVVTTASMLSARVAAAIDTGVRAIQRVAGRFLNFVILGGLQLLVFTPLWLLLRVLRRDPLALGASADDETFWRPTPRGPKRLYRRTFALERPPKEVRGGDRLPLPRVRAVVGIIALIIVLDMAVGGAVHGLRSLRGDGDGTRGLAAQDFPAGEGESWREGLGAEIDEVWKQKRYDPYLGWKLSDFDGEHVHVSGGVRRSYQAKGSASRGTPTVVFFGGSTMFGLYQRDEQTIPSEVAKLAEADGLTVRVVNRGQLAYVNWQETQLLEQLLAARRRPDLAVFYDGFNEVLSQFDEGPHSAPTHIEAFEIEKRLDLQSGEAEPSKATALYRAWGNVSLIHGVGRSVGLLSATKADPIRVERGSIWEGDQGDRPERRGRLAGDLYGRGVDVARRLAGSYGLQTAFFWQPSLYTKRVVAGEEQVRGWLASDPEAWSKADRAARARLPSGVNDISDALDGVRQPVMYDFVHTNELGAAVIARAIYKRLRPALVKLARQSP